MHWEYGKPDAALLLPQSPVSATARAPRLGARDAHDFAGSRGRTDAIGLNPPLTRVVAYRHIYVVECIGPSANVMQIYDNTSLPGVRNFIAPRDDFSRDREGRIFYRHRFSFSTGA